MATLPALPSLENKPTILRDAIAEAQNRAHTAATALVGTAQLGRLYHANGFLREAEACWRVLCAAQREEPRWHYYLADVCRTLSEYDTMSASLQRAAELAPAYAPVWMRLGDLAFKTGDFSTAARHYQRRLTLLPGDPYARLGLARIALQSDRREDARRAIATLVQEAPEFSPAQNLHAEFLAAAGDEAGARRHRWLGREAGRFRDIDDPWLAELNDSCHDAERLRVLGTLEFQINRPERARALVERAVQLAPDEPAGYELLGDLFAKLGEPERANEAFAEGIRRTPGGRGSIRLYAGRSEALRALRRPAEAAQAAEDGLRHWPEAFELYNVLGLALEELQRPNDAAGAYRAALARNPYDADANFNLGLALLSSGQDDAAQAHFQRALTAQPTFPKALLFLGQLELEAGRLEAAAEYIQPLFDAHPGQPQARQLMALWHLRSGMVAARNNDRARAEKHLRDGIAVEPAVAELHLNLGILLLSQGRSGEAVASLQTVRELQPENPQGALFLGHAYIALKRTNDARATLQEGESLAQRAGNSAMINRFRELLNQL